MVAVKRDSLQPQHNRGAEQSHVHEPHYELRANLWFLDHFKDREDLITTVAGELAWGLRDELRPWLPRNIYDQVGASSVYELFYRASMLVDHINDSGDPQLQRAFVLYCLSPNRKYFHSLFRSPAELDVLEIKRYEEKPFDLVPSDPCPGDANAIIEPLLERKPTSIIVFGDHDAGKTTLIQVLRDRRVVNCFENRRYFVSCHLASSAQRLAAMISSVLPHDCMPTSMLKFLKDSPNSLLVLDGLETPWRSNNIQDVVTLLKDIIHADIHVLATFYSKEEPDEIDWSHRLKLSITKGLLNPPRLHGRNQYSSPPLPATVRSSEYFTGREEFLACLYTRLQHSHALALNRAEALCGLGGIGKTRITIEFVIKFKDDYDLVYWCSAESQQALSESYVKLAQFLELPESKEDQASAVAAVIKWLSTSSARFLLVLDNVDNVEIPNSSSSKPQPFLFKFLPQEFNGDILITTRAHTWSGAVHATKVPLMDVDTGAIFLLCRAKRNPDDEADMALAKILAFETGGLPLALDQLGAWVQQCQSLTDCLETFRTQQREMLEERAVSDGEYDCHPDPMTVTFEMCLKKAVKSLEYDKLDVSAKQLLWLFAFLHADTILVSMLKDGAAYLEEPLKALIVNPFKLGKVVKALNSYSLIHRHDDIIQIHRLVQDVVRDQVLNPVSWAQQAVQVVNKVFPLVNYGTLGKSQPYLLHAEICVVYIKKHEMRIQQAADLAFACGQYYYYAGKYQEAIQLYGTSQVVLENDQKFVPTENQRTSVSVVLCTTAQVFWRQGHYRQAVQYYQNALNICEQNLGLEHYETALVQHLFARTLGEQGRYQECGAMFEQALCTIKAKLGPEDKMTARTEHEFARLLGEQGQFAQAETFSKHALEVFRRVEGKDHPTTASVARALCQIQFDQNKLDQCEETLLWCLDIMITELGPHHVETGTTLLSLAHLYCKQNTLIKAEQYYKHGLAIYDRLSPGHPDTVRALYQLAYLSQTAGNYKEAIQYYEKVMEIRKEQLDPAHICSSTAKKAYIALLKDMERVDEAKFLEQTSSDL